MHASVAHRRSPQATGCTKQDEAPSAAAKPKAKRGSSFKLPPAPTAKPASAAAGEDTAPPAEPAAAAGDEEAAAAAAVAVETGAAREDAGGSSAGSLKALSGPVADFVEGWMSHAVATINDGTISPTIHFLPGELPTPAGLPCC